MKVSQAITAALDEALEALVSAGIINGVLLTNDMIKLENRTICWPIHVRSKDASEKEQYITYNIVILDPFTYGDSQANGYKVTINIDLFTRTREAPVLIDGISAAFEAKHWRFNFRSMDYDPSGQVYIYGFQAIALIYE